jgi:hypothetical protein
MNERLRRALLAVDGVEEAASRYKDTPALWVNGTEIAHFEGDDVVDLRLTRTVIRERRAELRTHPSVRLRRSGSSDWLELWVRTVEDEALLADLFEAAAAAHRSPPGSTPAPPGRG